MKSAHYMQLYRYFAGILKNCCLEKTVGGVSYILSGWNEKKAKAPGCQNACMYQQANGQDRANYCFTIGSFYLSVENVVSTKDLH